LFPSKSTPASTQKHQRVEAQFTLEEVIRDGAFNSAGGDSLTGIGLNRHPSNACLTAAQQLPASRVKTSGRASTLGADVGHTCFFCPHSHIKDHPLMSSPPQTDTDLPLKGFVAPSACRS